MRQIAPAVKKETKRVAVITAVGTALMWAAFAAGHFLWPESIPFDYTVILGGAVGSLVAVANFFLMGLTVQTVANTADEDSARARMKASYTQRMALQAVWAILAITAPCFQFAAGLIPLLFPSAGLKVLAAAGRIH